MNDTQNTAGFTLIELLLYVTIISTLLLAVSFFFASSAALQVKNQAENDVTAQADVIMEQMTHSLRNADSVTSPVAGSTAAQLTLAVPTAAASPTIFSLNGTTLQMREGSGAFIALSSPAVAVTNLQFKNLSRAGTPGAVRISFTLARVAAGARDEFNFQRDFATTGALRP